MDKQQAIIPNYHPLLNKWLLSGGLILLLIHQYLFSIPIHLQLFFLVITVMLTGIPHGALDHLVAEQSKFVLQKPFSFPQFLFNYILRMIVFGVVWYCFPIIAFLMFLGISAFHFGETDLMTFENKNGWLKVLQFFYGAFILAILLLTHLEEVAPIVSQLPYPNISGMVTYIGDYTPVILATNGILIVISALVYQNIHPQPIKKWYQVMVHLLLMAPALIGLPLMLAFAFYFGCWHALHSLENIRLFLSSIYQQPVKIAWVLRKSIPLTLAAILLILSMLIFANYWGNKNVFLFGFFVGISILTAPHMEVMSSMYRILEKTPASKA